MIDVLSPEKRRRRSVQEKIAIVRRVLTRNDRVAGRQLSMALLPVSCSCGVKQYRKAQPRVPQENRLCPRPELASAMKQIKELQRLLGKKTMENELLKEAVEYSRQKKWIAHVPLLPEDGE